MRSKKICLVIITVVTALISANIPANQASGQVDPITEVEEKLQGISDIEQSVMENLFSLSQKIEETERQKDKISLEIVELQYESEKLTKQIEEKQKIYNEQLDILKKLLVSYQRRGPASFLETILGSESLSDFIQSLNLIRQITRNTDKLLNELEKRKNELASENEKLLFKEQELGRRRDELQNALNNMYILKEEQENVLNSLGEEREKYQNELERINRLWNEIKVIFSDLLANFTKMAGLGDFPLDALNLKFGFPKISGTIYDRTLNDILKEHPEFYGMVFGFSSDGVRVTLPEKKLSLLGSFVIENKTVLKFEVEEGSFYDMPLTEASLAELFKNGALVIDFKELMGNVSLESIKVHDGYLEFVIAPDI